MKTRSYNTKKLLSLIMLPFIVNSMAGAPALAQTDIAPGEGESVTLSGTTNVDRIIATGDNVTVTLLPGAELNVTDQYPAISLLGDSTVTLNAGSKITNTTTDAYAVGVAIINSNGTALADNTVTLDQAEISASATADINEVAGIFINDNSNGGTATVSLDNGSSVSATSTSTPAADTSGSAAAGGIVVYNTRNTTVSLDNASTIAATASVTTTGTGTSTVNSVYGIYAETEDNGGALVSLDNGSSVTATGTAISAYNADVNNVHGIYADNWENGDVSVTLDNGSTVTASGSATVNGANTLTDARVSDVYGIYAATDEGDTSVTLNNGSSVTVTASATNNTTGDSSANASVDWVQGIYAYSEYGSSTVTLDSASSIAVTTTSTSHDYSGGEAFGIKSYAEDYGDATVTLSNDSSVSTSVTSTVTEAAFDNARANANATGIYAYSDYGVTTVTLDSSSVTAASSASLTSTGADVDYTSANAGAYGIYADGYEGGTLVTLSNSTVAATATAANDATASSTADSNDADAWATGIYAYNEYEPVSVTLNDSTVTAEATATATGASDSTENDASADTKGIESNAYEGGNTVSLSNSSVSATANAAASDDANATAYGIYSYSEYYRGATVTLDNSSVDAVATATATGAGADLNPNAYAETKGIYAYSGGDIDAVVSLDNGSTVTATASATASGADAAVADAQSYGIYVETADADAIVTLDNGSSVTAIAAADGVGSGSAWSYGIYADGYDNAVVSLSGSVVTATATATASLDGGGAATASLDGGGEGADAWADGIDAESYNYDSTVTLDDASVTATATATHTGTNGGAYAVTNGIDVDANQQAIISLSNGSTVTATSTATTSATGGYAVAEATGMELWAGEQISVTLDNSSVSAAATATGETSYALATGIYAYNTDLATINLANGSVVSATASASDPIYASAMAIHVSSVTDATINIDATSSVLSSDYAIYSDTGMVMEAAALAESGGTVVNNAGLISGRLQVEELNNSATGVLEATLSAESAQMVGGANDDGSFYNTVVNTASLADGSTVSIDMADHNLGLLAPGDSEEYRILTAGAGNWTQANVDLQQSVGYSPMLNLSWSASSDANNLFAQATFLTPAQAGLSRNATAAFNAAYADRLFNFYSNPEDWTPDVSGANVFGKTQFVGSSQFSISKRLRQQESGANSGDGTAVNGAWADVRYTDADQDERDGIEGFDGDTTSFTVGYDRQIDSAVTLGAALSYGSSDVETDVSNEEFEMDDYLLTAYGDYEADTWFAEGQLSYGWGDVDGERNLFNTTLKSSYDSNVYYARVAGGLKYAFSGWQVLPQTSLDYTRVSFDDYTEKGGYMALDVENDDYDIANLGLGVQLLKSYTVKNNIMLTPEASAMVYYDLIGDDIETTSTFVHGTHSFVTMGADSDRTTYDLALGLTIGSVDSPVSFKVGYEYIARDDFESHNVNGRLNYEF